MFNCARSGGGDYPPSVFFVDSEKRAPPNFAELFIEHFDTLPENFDLLTSQVTPPGHIKRPDFMFHFSKFESLSKTHQ